MRNLLAVLVAVAMVPGVALACDTHAAQPEAAADVNNWLDSEFSSSGTEGTVAATAPSASGDRDNASNGFGNAGSVWIDVTLPDGSTVTVSTYSGSGGDHDERAHADLRENGKDAIRDWFQDYEPEDVQLEDFVG